MYTPPNSGRRKRKRRFSSASTNPILEYSSPEPESSNFRTAMQVAGAAAGGYIGGIPGAVDGYGIAGNIYDVGQNIVNNFGPPDAPAVSFPNKMSFGYHGSLGTPYRKKPSWQSKFASTGYISYKESFGSVADENCVYLTHATTDIDVLAYTLQACWCRKLLKKAGYIIDDKMEVIPSNALTGSEGMIIAYYTQEPNTGAIATFSYQLTGGVTFSSMVSSFIVMYNHLTGYFLGSETYTPYKLALFQLDQYNTAQAPLVRTNFMSLLNLTNEVVTVYAESGLTLQNRTAGAAASGAAVHDGDRLDSQPLHGMIYNSNADPNVKFIVVHNSNIQILKGFASTGVLLPLSTGLTEYVYHNVPKLEVWLNYQ